MRRQPSFGAFALLIVLSSCVDSSGDPADVMTVESAPETFWATSLPEEQGVDSGILAAALESSRMGSPMIHSIIIVRNGRLVLEHYIHPYNRDTLFNAKSISKSLLSALFGIAREEGVVSVDEAAGASFPEYVPATATDKMGITLRHLFTMSAGLDIDDQGLWDGIRATPDWVGNTWARPMIAPPGTHFQYSTGLTHIAGALLTRKTGQSLLDYARSRIFTPLGIEHVQWTRDPQGYYYGGCDVFLRPLDLAKLGALFAAHGRWNRDAVVPEAWVKESTTGMVQSYLEEYRYGYWWWVEANGWFHARGWGGQRIAINPDQRTVIVLTASSEPDSDELFKQYLRPALRSERALPENPEGVRLLKQASTRLSHPQAVALPPSDVATAVSGKRYRFDPNPLGLIAVTTWWEQPGEGRIRFERSAGATENPIGADGLFRISPLGTSGTEGSPPESIQLALSGVWQNNQLYFRYVELGNPAELSALLAFDLDTKTLDLTGMITGLFRQVTIHGVQEP